MLALPDEILVHILQCLDEKIIIDLSKMSTRINRIINTPSFWCSLLSQRTKYNEFTFCYVYNNDEILYHKTCFDIRMVAERQTPSLAGLSRDANILRNLWNVIKDIGNYIDFAVYCKTINLDRNDTKFKYLVKNLFECFEWSHHKINLYKTFSSSIFGFYKVLLSALNWQESCRSRIDFPSGTESCICGEDTPIFSPFCKRCRGTTQINKLLMDVIDNSSSFMLSRFDKIPKKEYIKYNDIQFYTMKQNDLIIFSENDVIYCVGIVKDKVARPVERNDMILITDFGFIHDAKSYDFIDYTDENNGINKTNDAPTLYVEPFLIVEDIEIYKAHDNDFIVIQSLNHPVCLGKLNNNNLVLLDEQDKILSDYIGLRYTLNQVELELVQKINKTYSLRSSPRRLLNLIVIGFYG